MTDGSRLTGAGRDQCPWLSLSRRRVALAPSMRGHL
eukprot:CAMPEP_0206009908 /NCGR_PEP_ID=MMETSP1464-20131121/10615_1 /ASSEMBLY_ACC=CAM_ASM_001124 /TAXON_ID=119497 /ORGANISM="Exanthemachrysis gayraliae, Strain RCC1523" /LENGTH=35 /DNA_ID= /DNA_START= /DNA_END= /DNA_ORIENTATION=